MDQEKNKNRIVILLVVLVVALTTFCMLLVTGVISFEKNVSDNKQHNDINEQKNNNIQSKRESIGCMDIDTVFNGITIKAKPEHDKGCHTESIVINDNVVSPGGNISSYEIYDNNVILFVWQMIDSKVIKSIVIYNIDDNSNIIKWDSTDLDGYKLFSYITDGNVITITGTNCDEKCGNSDDEDLIALFEVNYANNTFSSPVIIKKYTTKDLNDSIIISDLSMKKPVASSFGGSNNNMLAVPIDFNLDCSSNDKINGVRLKGYCLDKDNKKYSIIGPLSLLSYSCDNNEKKISMYVNQIFDNDGIAHDVDWRPNTMWEQIDIQYCKIEKAHVIIENASEIVTGIELNYEKEFK